MTDGMIVNTLHVCRRREIFVSISAHLRKDIERKVFNDADSAFIERKITNVKLGGRSASEVSKNIQKTLNIVVLNLNKDVNVLGRSYVAAQCNGQSANEDIFNVRLA